MLSRNNLDQTSLNLLAAADILEKKGHVKGIRRSEYGFCALGAIGYILGEEYIWAVLSEREEIKRVATDLPFEPRAYHCPETAIAIWNNKPERTAEEVINKFREVAYDPQYALVTA